MYRYAEMEKCGSERGYLLLDTRVELLGQRAGSNENETVFIAFFWLLPLVLCPIHSVLCSIVSFKNLIGQIAWKLTRARALSAWQ